LLAKNAAINLPYLIDGDQVITESEAIIVHILHKANKTELLGRDAKEQVAIATAYGVFKDFHPNYIKLVYGNYNEARTFETALK
jgi:glutathione S-transferase